MHTHRLLVEVTVDGDEMVGTSVQAIAEEHGIDPDEGKPAKKVLEKNIAILASSIVSLIHYGHIKGFKDSAEAMEEAIEIMNQGFIHSGVDIVDKKEDIDGSKKRKKGDTEKG